MDQGHRPDAFKNDAGGVRIKLTNGNLHAIVFGVPANPDIVGMKSALCKHVDGPQHDFDLRFTSHFAPAR